VPVESGLVEETSNTNVEQANRPKPTFSRV